MEYKHTGLNASYYLVVGYFDDNIQKIVAFLPGYAKQAGYSEI